ncbi:MAG: 23S rRNA (adenine(2503)-C(2))-methyltransferase RlmN [Verrucomicrobia bacterium]|nr:23S rRNA (adenine(2503)-C(2))-methyltransferase RlmN [Verrucomicrobiota bacterium]
MANSRPDIRTIFPQQLTATLSEWGHPTYRADQITQWVHRARAASWDEMTNVPGELRERLAETFSLHPLELVAVQGSGDTTRKFLWRLRDGSLIESVLIPANPALYGESSDRHTLCVSTQVGCAYGCRFCASGLEGWKRNLEPEEIVGQVYAVERWHQDQRRKEGGLIEKAKERLVSNLVIMGMGEPLANYERLMQALRILNASWGGGLGARKITVSTSGLAPQIRQLANEPEQFQLAISLHGATDPVRNRIMPVNRKYPLGVLMEACAYFREAKSRLITFEYILLAGINDTPGDAKALGELAFKLKAKVNLIPYNRVEGLPWERPEEPEQEAFLSRLREGGVTATLRREKGHDIDAACGQLRLRVEKAQAESGEEKNEAQNS